MEISLKQSNQLKSIAILMMLCLHLFNRDYKGVFQPLLFFEKQPLSYYISLFCDACVPIFAFVSGYGLYFKYQKSQHNYCRDNIVRLKKLYINYWIIILIFVLGIGMLVLKSPGYPWSWEKLFLNLTAIKTTYNGAWWFLTIYVLFVLTSEFWFWLLEKLNPYLYLLALGIIYLFAFYFRVKKPDLFSIPVLNDMQMQMSKFFMTLFQFMLGAFALRFKWNTKITKIFTKIKYKNTVSVLGIVVLIVIHALIPNFIIAPITGLAFIFFFCQLQLPKIIQKSIDFFTPHATNMWLVHMFFYLIFFPKLIYSFQYPIIIFFVLVLLCVISSYTINKCLKLITLKNK